MSKRAILISLSATITDDNGQEDALSLVTNGTLETTPAGYRLRYEEHIDEDEPPQPVTLLLEGDSVVMQREGDYETGMVFAKGQRYESQYHTPYGFIDMAVYCSLARYRVDDEAGELRLRYQLDVGRQFVSMHELTLQFLLKEGLAT